MNGIAPGFSILDVGGVSLDHPFLHTQGTLE